MIQKYNFNFFFFLFFCSVFGIPIIIDEVYNEERIEIIDDLLNQVATKPIDRSNDFQIPDNDFQIYINYAQSLSVAFDSRAVIMLKNYFMATKMIRPGEFFDVLNCCCVFNPWINF